ncbi:hypothetical protein PN419_00180 [Halorubrum ezzemoulense]|uniref:hypothetical protein n=1 Tax=Halorubrum ezzemoulense TaxID=337243 RepID=UPI00232AF9EE|nr:hypothetical protein [Halorubrum ezzemoulense]MDB9247423.1 hypothetical protein [Halorubrum ezzemoulense]MDB9258668.1 hypothetical protein [Halorubrum ezzemoulense]MDB9264474.1 hypothetical protein [Halorubrum ezzemoulense]MDB9269029.1 hypothetical protein [Halorubrum ezzemoulense]MDB9271442.1 hypothetical protein [Halorubrum ezzemoulense]
MADAFECDRCGELYNGVAPNVVETDNAKDGVPVLGGPHISRKEYELCAECGKLVEHILEGAEVSS